jgi:hypothetical protein
MNTPQIRRPATAADITVGAIVYKGKGKVAFRVVPGSHYGMNSNADRLYVRLVKATTATSNGGNVQLDALTVAVES